MGNHTPDTQSDAELADRVADLARSQGLKVAVAESLTAGRISSALGSGAGASEWYCGAVVAYDEEVKFGVLGVERGPVVNASCARQMATGVGSLLEADVALGITGVGGPDPEEGCPPGTVHLALAVGGHTRSLHVQLPGDPTEVVDAATRLALVELCQTLEDLDDDRPQAEPAAG